LGELGLLNYFKVIITGDDVEKVKPAPDLYVKAIEILNIHSTEAVAFEDSLNGLQSMAEKSLTDVIRLIEQ
jgi:putative hydrolase of the HAD superfamily